MSEGAPDVPESKMRIRASRILSWLVILFLLWDASMKILKLAPALQGTMQLGYPERVIAPIGMALLLSVLLYAIPATSVWGAILLTGYMGGATATMVRVQNPWFLFPVGVSVLAWLGIYLRDCSLRAAVRIRK